MINAPLIAARGRLPLMTTQATPAGVYPTGTAGFARQWDQHAWASEIIPDPNAPGLPKWHRRPWAVFGHRLFWLWLGCWIAGLALAIIYGKTHSSVVLQVAAVVAPAGTLWALLLFFRRRLLLFEAISVRAWIGWGLVAGVVGTVLAPLVEVQWEHLVAGNPDDWKVLIIAGPVEEGCKILVPVILYLFGRYRDPRAGIALALASGLIFGWFEGWGYITHAVEITQEAAGYVNHPHVVTNGSVDADTAVVMMAAQRPLVELMHPLLATFVAAMAWRAGWVRHRFWPMLIGAWLIAAVIHSANDVSTALGALAVVGFLIQIFEYFLATRPAARESTPPDALTSNPPRWRPRIPPHGQRLPTLAAVGIQPTPPPPPADQLR